jgi:hypothetical protein
VGVTLTNELNETVVNETRPLREWFWLRDFAQIRGAGSDQPFTPRGDTRFVRTNVKPDAGWGTSFEPRLRGRYTLTIRVVHPDGSASRMQLQAVMETYVGSL